MLSVWYSIDYTESFVIRIWVLARRPRVSLDGMLRQPLHRPFVSLEPQPGEPRLTGHAGVGDVAEVFAGVDVGQVHLHGGSCTAFSASRIATEVWV